MSNIDNLKVIAQTVKNETAQGENTATRVGSLLEGIIAELGTVENSITIIENKYETINQGNKGDKVDVYTYPPTGTSLMTIADIYVNGNSHPIQIPNYDILTPESGTDTNIIDLAKTDLYVASNGKHVGNIRIQRPSGSWEEVEVWGPKSGSSTDPDNPTTDPEVIDRITDLENELHELLENEDDRVNEALKEIFGLQYFVDGHWSGWDSDIEAYLSKVGAKTTNEDGETVWTWSYVLQKYDQIKTAVDALIETVDENGEPVSYEALQSYINQQVDAAERRVTTELGSIYALTDAQKNVLKWFTSGLAAIAGPEDSETNVWAAFSDKVSGTNAVSNLNTFVGLDANGQVEGKSSLASLVEDTVTGQITDAGIITNVKLGKAVADLFAKDGTGNDTVIAAVSASVQDHISVLDLTADYINNKTQSYTIRMDKLLIGGNSALFRTIENPEGRNLGFEMVAGDITINDDGTYTVGSNMYSKYRFGYWYTMLPKIVSHRLLFDNDSDNLQQYGAGHSGIDFSVNSTIRWFNKIGGSHITGDQYGYSDNSALDGLCYGVETGLPGVENEIGYIKFENNTVVIHGNLRVEGSMTHQS